MRSSVKNEKKKVGGRSSDLFINQTTVDVAVNERSGGSGASVSRNEGFGEEGYRMYVFQVDDLSPLRAFATSFHLDSAFIH